jgi:glycosyltransferase involved in cell wall biosynthesis
MPDGIDDPARPSGGNTYDRRLCRELPALGWNPRELPVAGFWTDPDGASFAALEANLAEIPGDAVVLLDGLIASTAPEVLRAHAGRLQLVVLVHMPLGHRPRDGATRAREGGALDAAAAIVTTSDWSRRRLVELYGLPAQRVRVAEPGAPSAARASGTAAGDSLLCVGAVTFEKGHDLLIEALASLDGLPWRCACVGDLKRDPAFVHALLRRTLEAGLGERVSFPGALDAVELDRHYESADLLVVASRAETYGMVITEALARGIPVLAAEVGGVAEALGEGAPGTRPGMLVAAEDPGALAAALRAWLADADLRARLREATARRRESLPRWSSTAAIVADVLGEVQG